MPVVTAAAPARAEAISERRLRILSVSSVFPNPREPEHGVFVRSRLQAIAKQADVTVLAPTPVFDYARRLRASGPSIPGSRRDGALRIEHPRWFYPPFGTAVNVVPLFARLIGPGLRHSPVDLIDAHFGYPEGIVAAMLAPVVKAPFAITLRGNEPMHARDRAKRKMLAFAISRAALVITLSERLREFAFSLGAREAVTIPNGVDAGIFYPRDRAEVRARFGFSPSDLIVLSAGSLIERKGHHRVLAAVQALRKRGIDVTLAIAGGRGREGSFEERLRRTAAASDLGPRVRFLGHLEPAGLACAMSAADVCCLASSREGWPNVVHESLACGSPVIATDVGAVPDMLPSENFGFILPPDDGPALENALLRALEKDWDRAAIARYGQSRSWDSVASEVLARFRAITCTDALNEL